MISTAINKLLIANRGEIACRVIRTARQLGIKTVAVYSDADRDALHVSMADEAVHIGAAPSRDSYLNYARVIEAAKQTGAQAIHPGYGFLSENADFCQACTDHNIIFVGPPVEAIAAMGSKSAAKRIMEAAEVPLVPGYHGEDQSSTTLKAAADEMGYPVLLKAVAGGGGKGMRQVWQAADFDEALAAAKRESMGAFGNDDMLVEKYLTQPRHVEIQVFCDQHGNAVYLFERDCSLQRRHQKVIEEAPAPGLSEELRQQMGEAAIRAAQAINYQGAGTVEFLLDSDGSFYFMEMNTRLQVEHPVTEMITGQDLVEWQLQVAAGEALPAQQHELQINGHAFEARIYAEDPDNEFLPDTGTLSFLQTPIPTGNVRVDTGVVQGDQVSVHYDPMIAKLIVWDSDRDSALQRLQNALRDYRIHGVKTNIDFLHRLSSHPAFAAAKLETRFIENHHDSIFQAVDSKTLTEQTQQTLALASLYLLLKQGHHAKQAFACHQSPWRQLGSWRLNQPYEQQVNIAIKNEAFQVTAIQLGDTPDQGYRVYTADSDALDCTINGELNGNSLSATLNDQQINASVGESDTNYRLFTDQYSLEFTQLQPQWGDIEHDNGDSLTAPMNGTVVTHLVAAGADVKADDALIVMEAMKMEHTLRAPSDGKVIDFFFQPGELVDGGAVLVNFEANAS